MSEQKKLESAAAIAGVYSRVPQAIIHHSAASLRHLLDDGVSPEDPRCLSLLQLANTARLHILPQSNDGAAQARNLTERAIHVDVSTATMAAAMGLKNTSNLTGAAVELATSVPPRPVQPSTSSDLKLKLLPKLSQSGFDSLINLVRTDSHVGLRPRQAFPERMSVAYGRLQKPRMRQPSTRRRRRMVSDPSAGGMLTPLRSVTSATASAAATLAHPFHTANNTPPSSSRAHLLAPRCISVTFADEAVVASQQKAQSGQLIPFSAANNASQSAAQTQSGSLTNTQSNIPARLRSRQTLLESRPKGVQSSIAFAKGVMNDAIGTPDDVMEAFMHPTKPSSQPSNENADSPTRLRSVLSERERVIIRHIQQRRKELEAIPPGVTERTRRKAMIELKKLSLLDLQRVVRQRVCAEMKKIQSSSVQDSVHVPSDNMSRLFRRRDPPIYSYMDGYPRISPFDGVPEIPPRQPDTIAQDSLRMAEFDQSRMDHLKQRRKEAYLDQLRAHAIKFTKFFADASQTRSRTMKSLERYFLDKKRAEERRRKMERIERLKLLKSNDEQAYLNLLENTKNERLLQLVRQTDNYLMQIGAQVEQQREAGEQFPGSSAHDAFAEELGEKGEVPLDAMRRRRDLYYTVTHAVQEDVQQPSIMVHGTLKPYQLEGLKWMVSLYNNNLNGILADEMGLGKTIQAISLITYLIEVKKNSGPFLVIVPLSVMGNWVRELDLWAPSVEKIQYRGDRKTRREIWKTKIALGTFNVLLTTYEFIVKDQTFLSRINWQYIIIDEGHRMKNANCKLALTLGVKYKSRNRLLLTGTPLQNNLTELWALLNFLLPSIFSSSDTFETWFKQPFETTTLGDSAELEEEERLLVINRLHQVLRPFLLRRLKTDVEAQLPEKVEHVIHCHMSSWQQVLYGQVRDRIGLATGAHNGSVRAFNNLLMQFKKVCNHPFLFYDSESVDYLPPDYLIRASGKFFLLHHMLPKLQLHGHRTLIFSQMTFALDLLESFLSTIGIRYLRLDGKTRSDERQDLLNQFNAKDSPYFCFLLSTRAGGLGLNLQTADTVIIFDSDWNPMMDLQAQDRAHRIGQTQVVRVYRLISAGTVEMNILEQANKKLQVDAQIIQAGQFNNKSTESDRHNMLKTLLRQQNKEGEETVGVPSMEELNKIIGRTDEEIESFMKLDETSRNNGTFIPLMTETKDLPDWVLKPNIEHKDEKQRQQELLDSHGRGRRRRKAFRDMDRLTDAEWLMIAEGEITVDEAFEKRQERKSKRQNKIGKQSNHVGSQEDDNDDDDDENDSNFEVEADADEVEDVLPREIQHKSKSANCLSSRDEVKGSDDIQNRADLVTPNMENANGHDSNHDYNGPKNRSGKKRKRPENEKVLLRLKIKRAKTANVNKDSDGEIIDNCIKVENGKRKRRKVIKEQSTQREKHQSRPDISDDVLDTIEKRPGGSLKIRFPNPSKNLREVLKDTKESVPGGLKIRLPIQVAIPISKNEEENNSGAFRKRRFEETDLAAEDDDTKQSDTEDQYAKKSKSLSLKTIDENQVVEAQSEVNRSHGKPFRRVRREQNSFDYSVTEEDSGYSSRRKRSNGVTKLNGYRKNGKILACQKGVETENAKKHHLPKIDLRLRIRPL